MDAAKRSGTAELLPLEPGTIVGKHYVVVETLGVGSKSVVYLCKHEVMRHGAPLAVKLLHKSLLANERIAKRFEQELITSYHITHPNVIRTYEYINDQNVVGYSMEYAAGGSLRGLLDKQGALPIKQVLQIAGQIAVGLQAIHAVGIVHRDLKPGNILFSERGTAKISDFGVALNASGPRLTTDGELLGTIGYSGPEYIQHGLMDERCDIYALGLMMYEMISGEFPFTAANPLEALKERLTRDPVALDQIRRDCPPEVAALVQRAMARDPNARFQSATELLQALRALSAATAAAPVRIPETRLASVRDAVQEAVQAIKETPEGAQLATVQLLHPPKSQPDADAKSEKRSHFATRRAQFAALSSVSVCLVAVALLLAPRPGVSKEITPARSHLPTERAVLLDTVLEGKPLPEPVMPAQAVVEAAPQQQEHSELSLANQALEPTVEQPAATEVPNQLPNYHINRGDTLTQISRKLNISMEQLVELNKINNPDLILAGEALALP